MNVGLETLTELVSLLWNADVNNGAGIVLCDSSKLDKHSKRSLNCNSEVL